MDNELLDVYRQELSTDPQYTYIVNEAFNIVKSLKISVNDYVGEAPGMPRDISNLTDADLGEFLNQQTQWASYLETKLSEFQSYHTVLENELEFTTANIHTDYVKDETMNARKITERKELMKTDKRYISLNREKLKYEIVCNILKANLNAANNNWTNISRQITLKGQDEQRQFRTNNALNFVSADSRPRPPMPKGFGHKAIGVNIPEAKRTTRK